MLPELGIKLHSSYKMFVGRCIHAACDNASALNIYKNTGIWRCWSRQCHTTFNQTLLGFVRMALSVQNHGWEATGDKVAPFYEVIAWVISFLKVDLKTLKVQDADTSEFVRTANYFKKKEEEGGLRLKPEEVRRRLIIPAAQMLRRGFTREVLEQYDVGFCNTLNSEMYGRDTVPIRDETGKWIIGAHGRSVFPKCPNCAFYHLDSSPCPINPLDQQRQSKWRVTKNFPIRQHLFNWWNAKPVIKNSGCVYVVEGALDCLRMIEAGIINTVGLYGASLSDAQQILLERSGAMKLVIITDMDEAGRKCAADIELRCRRDYKIVIPQYSGSDPGSMSVDQIKKEILL